MKSSVIVYNFITTESGMSFTDYANFCYVVYSQEQTSAYKSLGCLITRKLRGLSCILLQELIPIIQMYLYFSHFDIFVYASKNNCFVAGVFKDTKLCSKSS